jgi:putative FmdB family regulatory protein
MPIYAYKCTACGHRFDALQKISEEPLRDCPSCGAAALAKQLTAAGFQLKGSGWYATDFKNGSAKPEAPKDGAAKDEAAKGEAAKGEGAKAEGKGKESAPAQGTDPAPPPAQSDAGAAKPPTPGAGGAS